MSGAVLVTGAGGFVGRHLLRELGAGAVASDVDVTDAGAVARAVTDAQPDAVVHLAAVSSVAESWGGGSEVWRVNTIGTVNVLDAVAAERPDARVLFVSTGEVYGRIGPRPAREEDAVAPVSPYAASKAAAEIACARAARADGLDVVVARAFSHAGPDQDERFAIGSWAHQIARLEARGGGALEVGNLDAERDLTDVRDVCRAYRLLLDRAVPAAVYNVASGTTVPMKKVVELLTAVARSPIAVRQDPSRLRPADTPVLAGDPARLREATGWTARIPLEETLADALESARAAVSRERLARA